MCYMCVAVVQRGKRREAPAQRGTEPLRIKPSNFGENPKPALESSKVERNIITITQR